MFKSQMLKIPRNMPDMYLAHFPFTAFCRIPSLGNGTVHNVTVGSYVPNTFKIHVSCNPGFRLTKGITTRHSEHDIPLNHDENMCLSTGKWAEDYRCQWDMPYNINGTFSRGIVKLYFTSKFLVPPGVHTVDVICIGGGGGGYSHGLRGGDGGASMFGDRLKAFGGRGGTARYGGSGGWGYRHLGGRGGNNGTCWFGGAAGQINRHPNACVIGSTDCPFCGAGGYGNTTDCPATDCVVLSGACSGPWAIKRKGLSGSDYGGGAGSLSGGSGGAAGYSRRRWMPVKPEQIVTVTVGAGGQPSSASPGNGIVVVAWGDKIEHFLPSNSDWKRRSCHYMNPLCSCLRDMGTYRFGNPNRYL
ncbi:PE-PGRS family protein PE_PGRS18-like [Haliotis asinina]|uniref:PE-PGRS family protein PE_PGRS18-like n=1 Tax=Haliotis asinina TaxID=109174 RepID=UPI00353213B9